MFHRLKGDKMRKLLVIVCLLISPLTLQAQESIINGSITANGQSVVGILPPAAIGGNISISGTWTGTLTFRFTTLDGITRDVLLANPTSGTTATTTTANGSFTFPNPGWRSITVIATATVTGTANISITRGVSGSSSAGGGGAASSVSVTNLPVSPDGTSLAIRCVNLGGTAFEACGGGSGGGGAAQVDNTALASITGTGYLYDLTPPTITDGNVGTPRMDVNRYQYVVFPAAQAVTGSFFQATQPVSGTFFQSTQPVSMATAPTTPVTGTFWQTTQPVSGTFWQATQPVSMATAPTTPVTGTFWQSTQPVNGSGGTFPITGWPTTASTAALAVRCVTAAGSAFESCAGAGGGGSGLTDTELRATAVPVSVAGGAVDETHGSAVIATGPANMLEAKDQDGVALPNNVTEGSAVRAAGSLYGVQYVMPVNEDGSAIASMTANAGTNLNTSALLTSTAFTTSFGTAGTPASQVNSVQGISGGTPVGVQSNGANLATQTTLASIDTKFPAQGQALAAASIPVILPSATITTLTPPAAITGFATSAKQPALGVAGTPSTDVQTFQGCATCTPEYVLSAATATVTNSTGPHYVTATASTNSNSVKGSPGNVYTYYVGNTTATTYYLRMYNLATAPTCSSATGFVRSYPIPPNGFVLSMTTPQGFSTGIGYCITGARGSTDVSNAAVGIDVNIDFK